LIDVRHPDLTIARQCELVGLSRSSFYYEPTGESSWNLHLMRLIDEQYTRTPFFGSPQMTRWLRTKTGEAINPKRVARLMRRMGLQAVVPGPHTSRRHPEHLVYPYLLRGLEITRPNHVWATDITYIPMLYGFLYLVAIMDWYSRYVLSWRLSNTLDPAFCVEALEEALELGKPEIFNSDQGTQFTSDGFTGLLKRANVQISMDGRGRFLDNIFVERLWRSVKYEEVYLKDYQNGRDAYEGLGDYFPFYNTERPHEALAYRTPWEVHQA
jgi:putative transposase